MSEPGKQLSNNYKKTRWDQAKRKTLAAWLLEYRSALSADCFERSAHVGPVALRVA